MTRSALALITCIAFVACKDEDEGPPQIVAEDLCFEYAMAVCEGMEKCCADMGYTTGQQCLDGVFDSCESYLLRDDLGVTSSTITFEYDASGAAALVQRVRSTFETCEGEVSPSFDDTHSMSKIDGPCIFDEDCVEAAACLRIGSSGDGRCVAAPAEGEPCQGHCASSEHLCRWEHPQGLSCGRPFDEGARCDSNGPGCGEGLFCTSCPECVESTCTPLFDVGDDCTDTWWGCGPGSNCVDVPRMPVRICEASDPRGAFCNSAVRYLP